MFKATLGREIVIRVKNHIGILADIARALSEKGISVLAMGAWVEGEDGVIHFVTDDNLRASDALRRKKYDLREDKVVLAEIPHKPGMLKQLSEVLMQADIDIRHIYTSALSDQEVSLVVFSSSNNDRAVVSISRQPSYAQAGTGT